jgi:site-specific recombinase XerD
MRRFSTLFYIKRGKKKLSNGECPIYVRLTLDKHRAEFAANVSVEETFWSTATEKAAGKSRKAWKVNNRLDGIRNQIAEIERKYELRGIALSVDQIKNEILGINKACQGLVEAHTDHNKKLEALVGMKYAPKTLARYNTSLNHLKSFLKEEYKVNDIDLRNINHKFLMDYEFWLNKNNCQHNTTIKYLVNLKKIIRIALNNGWMVDDPYKNTKLSFKDVDKPYLTSDELTKILNKEFSIKRVEKVRDVFLFCCFTGLAFSDVKSLQEGDISTENNGIRWIRKHRQKTKIISHIPLLPVAEKILDKYKNDLECIKEGTLLPVPSNQRMNSYLKEIADLCDIKKTLTTHVARHTFGTTVTLANHISMESVSRMLGHSSQSMTRKYARILDEPVANEMDKIKNIY